MTKGAGKVFVLGVAGPELLVDFFVTGGAHRCRRLVRVLHGQRLVGRVTAGALGHCRIGGVLAVTLAAGRLAAVYVVACRALEFGVDAGVGGQLRVLFRVTGETGLGHPVGKTDAERTVGLVALQAVG